MPFLLWAYAALSLTAGLLSVLNATSPMWGALCSALLLGERLTARAARGTGHRRGRRRAGHPAGGRRRASPCCRCSPRIVAAFCYGLIATYIAALGERRALARHGGRHAARGRHRCSFRSSRSRRPRPRRLGASSSPACSRSACVCSAIAYLLYFRLIADIGATGALTVTYLIPVFGVLWGALFLGETISLSMLARRRAGHARNLLRSAKMSGFRKCAEVSASLPAARPRLRHAAQPHHDGLDAHRARGAARRHGAPRRVLRRARARRRRADRHRRLLAQRRRQSRARTAPNSRPPTMPRSIGSSRSAVHDAGGRIVLQLLHSGRYGFHERIVAPSAVKSPINPHTPREMTPAGDRADHRRLRARRRARARGGLRRRRGDGLRGLPDHPVPRARTNHRTDDWGGPLENRMRFADRDRAPHARRGRPRLHHRLPHLGARPGRGRPCG